MVQVVLLRISHIRHIFLALILLSVVGLIVGIYYCQMYSVNNSYCYIDNSPYNASINETDPPRLLSDIMDVIGFVRRKPHIFFIETSCNQMQPLKVNDVNTPGSTISSVNTSKWINLIHLSARQACAVESSARYNLNSSIIVLFASPTYSNKERIKNQPMLSALKSYRNVHFLNVNLWRIALGTPLNSWLKSGALFSSEYMLSHTSDFLRFSVLLRFGGTYLDLDTITLRSIEDLPPNYVGAQADGLAAGVINADVNTVPGQKMVWRFVYDFKMHYRPSKWSYNGPLVVERSLKDICPEIKLNRLTKTQNCKGVTIYAPPAFYPISYGAWFKYFQPIMNSDIKRAINDSYMVHVWNKYSSNVHVEIGGNMPYEILAKQHCPRVYATAGKYL